MSLSRIKTTELNVEHISVGRCVILLVLLVKIDFFAFLGSLGTNMSNKGGLQIFRPL